MPHTKTQSELTASPSFPVADSSLFSLRAPLPCNLLWSWATRHMNTTDDLDMEVLDHGTVPRAGDLLVCEVVEIGFHGRMFDGQKKRSPLLPGQRFVGVAGSRYATDAYGANLAGIDTLHIVTGSGMVGTVASRHASMRSPTRLRCLGRVAKQEGAAVNLIDSGFRTRPVPQAVRSNRAVFVVGSGMNAGKTTVLSQACAELAEQGKRVAALKLTGSLSVRDPDSYRHGGAAYVRDFSDYGFPSTFNIPVPQIIDLFSVMLADALATNPDVILVELADGVLQNETYALLQDERIRRAAAGVLVAAPCPLSAIGAAGIVQRSQHNLVGISGPITNAPLLVQEFEALAPGVPVLASAGLSKGQLAAAVSQAMGVELERA